jgi:glycosyltransferase involved in cell wall biosynthesis
VASRLGAMQALVQHGVTGAHFEAGSAAELAATLAGLHAQPLRCAALGAAARQQYERELTPAAAYRELSSVYDGVVRQQVIHE